MSDYDRKKEVFAKKYFFLIIGMPIVLSGGLNPSNIRKAISTVRPYAVDVNSGIEERPGKKSPLLMKELMETIERTDEERPKNDG